jgi:hypothetical protein
MCDENKMYTAYGEITMPNGSKNVIQLKYEDETSVNNTPFRLRMTLSGSNPNIKRVKPIMYNGMSYVPNPAILYGMDNCIAGGIFSGSKMIFPYIPANSMMANPMSPSPMLASPMSTFGGKKKTRSSRKKTRKSRRAHRKRTVKRY